MMDEADHSLYIHAERKGWPTQSSTAAMAILYQLGFEIGRQKTQQVEWLSDLEAEFKATVDLINPVLDDLEGSIASIAKNEAANDLFLFAGGGPAFTCASFGAAKTKELTSSHAIAIPLEEYHHYRSQKSGEPLFLVAPQGYSTIRARDTGIKGLENGGHVYAIVTKGDRTLDGSYTQRLDLPLVNELFVPLLYTLPLQQFAYYLAMEKFSLAGLV
jgi:glucosamine--fructose-6-phosphate aminotransferase (isomerizing)